MQLEPASLRIGAAPSPKRLDLDVEALAERLQAALAILQRPDQPRLRVHVLNAGTSAAGGSTDD